MNLQNFPKLPELGDMAKKLFGDIKKSVEEIYTDYKARHPLDATPKANEEQKVDGKKAAKKESVAEEKKE